MDDAAPIVLDFKPTIIKQKTDYASEGFWTDSNLVRFSFGRPENWKGWNFASDAIHRAKYVGHARDIIPWVDLSERKLVAIGNERALYVWESGVYYNITPVVVSTSGSNILSTQAGSTEITVSVSDHNYNAGEFIVLVSNNTTIGGNVLPSYTSVRTPYEITSVVSPHAFKISTGVTAAATSLSTGGAVDVEFLLDPGLKDYSFLYGWGIGDWGEGLWGITSAGEYAQVPITWSLDLWGENLIALRRMGPLYAWNNDLNAPAVTISGAPNESLYTLVSPEDRHLVVFGTVDASSSAFDPMLIRWCSRENYNDWSASAANTAGFKRLSGGGSSIIGARRSRGQMLIWTDHDLYGMAFIGGDLVFSFNTLGESCGIIAPHAHVEMGGITYWMSTQRFYMYDGAVKVLSCTVLDHIFENLDFDNKVKIYGGINPHNNEIIWFYPDINSPNKENNRYVCYNIVEDSWTVGSIDRCVWSEDNIFDVPIAVGTSGDGLFYHELGHTAAGSAMDCYIESAYFDVQDGKNVMHLSRIVPDFSSYDQDEPNAGTVFLTMKARNFPKQAPKTKGPFAVTSGVQRIDTRLRGRQFAIRVESNNTNNEWRMGNTVIYLQEDGEH